MEDIRSEILNEIKMLSLNSIQNLKRKIKILERKHKSLEEKYYEFMYNDLSH
jgi:hypothetical protein